MFSSNIEKIKEPKKYKKERHYDCELENIIDNTVNLLTIHDKISNFLINNENKKKELYEKINFLRKSIDEYNNLTYEIYYKEYVKLDKYITFDEYYFKTCKLINELHLFEETINKYDTLEIIYKRKKFKEDYFNIIGIFPSNTTSKEIIYDCCEKGSICEDKNELVCYICGKVYNINIIQNTEENINYKDLEDYHTNKKSIPEYHKSSHLKEKLEQKLGLNISSIPIDIINKVKEEVKRERIELNQLKIFNIHKILKKLGYVKYYEYEYAIYYSITGVKLLNLEPIVIKQIEGIFSRIENIFKDVKYKNRKSMFMYDYTIRKILEILGYLQESKHFLPPKDRVKVLDYDKIWKEICIQLGYEFIPTLD